MNRNVRVTILALAMFLLATGSFLSQVMPALAVAPQPTTAWSFYVLTTNTSTLYNLGCNQGTADWHNGNLNSEIILDFGGQASGNNGTNLLFSYAFVSYATIESLAENYADGWWICSGADYTSVLDLTIGTNNSNYHIDSAGGAAWAGVVNTVRTWASNNGFTSQLNVGGANDMEPGFDTYPPTKSWVDGYTSAGGPYYVNYGSADGCPQTTHTNGGCNNGWNQDGEWYVSYGALPAYSTPEIYYQSQANQWGQIKLWKYMAFHGPLDEHDLNTSTFTPAQAWTALWNAEGGTQMLYSLEVHHSN